MPRGDIFSEIEVLVDNIQKLKDIVKGKAILVKQLENDNKATQMNLLAIQEHANGTLLKCQVLETEKQEKQCQVEQLRSDNQAALSQRAMENKLEIQHKDSEIADQQLAIDNFKVELFQFQSLVDEREPLTRKG